VRTSPLTKELFREASLKSSTFLVLGVLSIAEERSRMEVLMNSDAVAASGFKISVPSSLMLLAMTARTEKVARMLWH